jgi:hypothetical protein
VSTGSKGSLELVGEFFEVRTQVDRGLTIVNRVDRRLGLIKNLGRHRGPDGRAPPVSDRRKRKRGRGGWAGRGRRTGPVGPQARASAGEKADGLGWLRGLREKREGERDGPAGPGGKRGEGRGEKVFFSF